MADDPIPMFPTFDLSDLESLDEIDGMPSEEKWSYVMDFEQRKLMRDTDGQLLRTKTYEEYLVQVAMRILNTERFRHGIYDEEIGVERSEWPGWSDIEIKRDIEEALEAHMEIEKADVKQLTRGGSVVYATIKITGAAGAVEWEADLNGG
ncbi:DUF2634 domain-containing protein [Aneurinibacillus soli]|nr:DUF2634 domain-containing protein [Aneurinibacillus soli]